jgi:hypothetical protein
MKTPQSTPEKQRYSISRAIRDMIERGVPTNEAEADFHFEALRTSEKSGLSRQLGWPGRGFIAPLNASRVGAKRQLSVGESGWVGTEVVEGLGVIGWSAVVRSGATLLGPLAQDLTVWRTTDLPAGQWLPETGLILPADPIIGAVTLTPRRIAAQVIFSRQLFVQATPAVDVYVTREIGRSLSSALDAACLYGRGANDFEPLGVLNTPNVNQVPFMAPNVGSAWLGLNDMRLACLDHDVSSDSYALISSPQNERELFMSQPGAATGPTTWHSIPDPKFFSREVHDNRFFSGCWAYCAIGLFGGTADQPGYDVVVDPFTQAANARVVVTASLWCDCSIRWPEVFAFSDPDPIVFAAKGKAAEKTPQKAEPAEKEKKAA